MRKELIVGILTLASFAVYYALNEAFFSTIYYAFQEVLEVYPLSFFLAYAVIGIPVIIVAGYLFNWNLPRALGLNGNPLRALGLATVFTAPMFLGYGSLSGFNTSLEMKGFWFGCVFAGFFEELYYRGFFFGMLHRKTRLGFLTALILSAIIFASLHLYQSSELGVMVGVFLTTFMGAGLFAWLYVEWEYDLWVPIALHFMMNLSWGLFNMADNALGGIEANIFRAATITLAIVLTIAYKRIHSLPMAINSKTLIFKPMGITE